MSLIAEIQLTIKEVKRRRWLSYSATRISTTGVDAAVLVITPFEGVAEWARQPPSFGAGLSTFRPHVVGPRDIPFLDADRAKKDPYLAVLSAVAHGKDEDVEAAANLATAASRAVSPLENGVVYIDLIKASLGQAAREAFEMLAYNYEFQDELLKQACERGKVEGEAVAILRVLEARNLKVSEAQRSRILKCSDTATLERWVRRAATVATTDQVFEDE